MKKYQKPDLEAIKYTADALSASGDTQNGLYNYEINNHNSWNNDKII